MSAIFKIFVYIFCIILLSLLGNNNGQEIRKPATEFSRFKLVKPLLYHAKTKREITSTKHTDDMHYPEVTMTIDMDGEQHMLDMKLNKDLVAGGHIIRYQKDGHRILHKPTIQELDICQYSGTVRGRNGSWAALSTCHGVRGIIHDGEQTRYIEPAEGNNIDSNHYIYNDFDLKTNYEFGSHQATNKTNYPERMKKYQEEQRIQSVISRHEREQETKYKGPFDSNRFSRYLELALVADNALYKAYGENIANLHMHLRDIANIVHSLFAPWNIYVALVGVDIWTEKDEIKFEDNITDILSSFLYYRETKLGRDIPNDNAQLLINYKSSSMVLKDAILGSMCNEQLSGGVIRADSQDLGIIATRIAHSIGHNFNMSDDSDYCYCPGDSCIMCPSINENKLPTHWSSCSFLSLINAYDKGLGYCLRNKPKRLFGSPFCGNGFIEFNEECDCGVYPSVECTVCCNPLTCLLKPNATCALGECCDLWTCQLEEILTVCRPEKNECDLPEYCNGFSGDCPKDVHMMDTTPCSDGEAYCVKGECSTHSDRCKLLWGESGRMSNKKCYETFNVQGNENGYCSYRRGEQITYKECSEQDTLCGLLHCEHDNSSLQIGMGDETTKSNQVNQSFANSGLRHLTHFYDCNTAMLDLSPPEEDPGLVPDGAKCGEGMMCLKQKCVSIASIRQGIAKMKTSICPSNCSGNGICNSEGHCHCSLGFEPPLCNRASIGSIDSGPTYYIKNKPKPLFGPSFCGNGFIEFNEECDCGVYPSVECTVCCNPLTCLLKPNATCAVGECCDLLTCQLKKILTVCRPEMNECDLPEYCNGFSGDCPKDVHMMDTTPCSDDEAYCVKGECSTHSDRCELLWGDSGRMSNKKCYETFNVQGNENGYCSYRRGEQISYKECSEQDALCGLLHCEHDNSSLQIGMGYETTKSNQVNQSFANSGLRHLTDFHDCNTAMIDLGPSEKDPGLVPDGAKCGEEMMCLKQKCVSIASIRQGIVKMKTFICPSNCSGNGICNSEGHCHCSFGLAPPLCNRASVGSIDSGPIYYIKSGETALP